MFYSILTQKGVIMENEIKPINPGQQFGIGSPDHLTQIQHKGPYVDIVDHFDHGPDPVDVHIITQIDREGNIETGIE